MPGTVCSFISFFLPPLFQTHSTQGIVRFNGPISGPEASSRARTKTQVSLLSWTVDLWLMRGLSQMFWNILSPWWQNKKHLIILIVTEKPLQHSLPRQLHMPWLFSLSKRVEQKSDQSLAKKTQPKLEVLPWVSRPEDIKFTATPYWVK